MNKEYRIDTFFGKDYEWHLFESEHDALIFAGKEAGKGKDVFLSKHLCNGRYDVIEQIK